ncbi:hypothetical protein SERLA73DRAFT_188517 [Serpula lacrymans var. lacrymans S7.3]|uniref:PBP domain-containing protein n=2 Tax=Serpula lacrymans var. lacrymans TaxID=341189 RepID=F8QBG9_SERL3|nr:uncharacterized protein SERLADRAFT_478652 [Serpula lacrymans var. lacrymans S7.9]EGN94555.1 hypothetical protein SERLA73DRAFT_188517 [Serpula lacrymans var. lacrymans S7.3]EGO20034.1 hypothetical protein SERLADRAFT_478652 [Serpula lacrymans var. lacrymans S7.9]
MPDTAVVLPEVSASALTPKAVYNGGYANATEICVRVANGGAGQAGLIGNWADAYIQYRVSQGSQPFLVAWYLGDTTESLAFLAEGEVDIAVTYNKAAEDQAMRSKSAIRREYAFRDHFLLAGPTSDPAGLDNITDNEDRVLLMFNQIVSMGNKDILTPPTDRSAVRFLSRYDKSATNIKESQIFCEIGQVPWAYAYSKWYHQYPRFPLEALSAASLLAEYTLSDHGIWLSSPANVKSNMKIYAIGLDSDSDADETNPDILLNPAHILLGARADEKFKEECQHFMDWVVSPDGGQKVIREFKKEGEVLYSEAPKAAQRKIQQRQK